MRLTVITPEIRHQQYACQGCTNCCRELVVHLTDVDRQKIDRDGWKTRLGAEPYVRLHGGYVLNHADDGACVFLTAAGRCRIHEERGASEKPIACQLFPFTLEREGAQVRAGLRFDCPTVARNDGPPLASHRADLERLTVELQDALPALMRDTPAVAALTKDRRVANETIDHLVVTFERLISRRNLSLRARLMAICETVNQLQLARLSKLDEQQITELVTLFGSDLETRAATLPAPPLPKARWLKILRQSAFAHAEYVTFEQAVIMARPSLGYRWAQLKRAFRMAGGKGPIPAMSCGQVDGTFEQLRTLQMANGHDAEIDRLLTRYLQSRMTNRGGFGRAYYGWPMLEGMQASMLAMALVGWFARWSALGAGRSAFELEDVQVALRIVDRAAGRAPELGARTAELRIRYLAGETALASLIDAYALY